MNKKIKSILAMGLVALTGAAVLGCGAKGETSENIDSLSAIKEEGKLVVGLSADYAPYEFHILDEKGEDQIVGFDIRIAEELAKDMGVELEIKDMDFDSLISTVPTGKIDLIISGMTPTEERKAAVDFSDIYYVAEQGMLVLAENKDKYKTFSDFDGKKIGAQLGSIQADLATTEVKDAQVQLLANVNDLLLELKAGKIEGLIVETAVAEVAIANNADLAMIEETKEDTAGGSAIAMKKDSAELKDQVNATIKRITEAGLLDEFIVEANELSSKAQ